MDTQRIRVSIIEDSAIHMEFLKLELGADDYYEIVSTDRLGRQGLESVKKHLPDIVLLDFQLEDITGLEVSKRIKRFNERIKIFSITAHTEALIIERIIQDKNIDAIAIKGSPYFENNFLEAIKVVIEGGSYVDPSLLTKLRELNKGSSLGQLTRAEFEIFIQMNIGKKDSEIAKDLFVELSHVRNMKSRIIKKISAADSSNLSEKLVRNFSVNV